jgi:hypothetical protein
MRQLRVLDDAVVDQSPAMTRNHKHLREIQGMGVPRKFALAGDWMSIYVCIIEGS